VGLELRTVPFVKKPTEVIDMIRDGKGHFGVMPLFWEGPPTELPYNAIVEPTRPLDERSDEAYKIRANTIDDAVNAITSLLANKPETNPQGQPYAVEFDCDVTGYRVRREMMVLLFGEGEEENDI